MKLQIKYLNTAIGCSGLELVEEGKIKATALAVLIALASFVDGSTMSTRVDQVNLAKRAGVSLETLRRQLRILEKVGILTTTRRYARSNIYKLNPVNLEKGSTKNNPQNSVNIAHKSCEYSSNKSISGNRNEDSPETRATTY